MRHSLKAMCAAVLLGMGLMTSQAHAIVTENFTVTFTPTGSGATGTWKAFEQTTYTGGSASNGLAGIQFNVTTTGGIALTSGILQLPSGFDSDPGSFGSSGFVLFKTNGSISGGQITGMRVAQALSYQVNPAGDVFNVYTGVGNVAETIPTSDDGSGDGGVGDAPGVINGTKTVTLPVLIASGAYTNNGTGGTISTFSQTTLDNLLPVPMPSDQGGNIQSFSPDALNFTPATVPGFGNIPEPASIGLMALGGLMTLSRRRRNQVALTA